MFKLYAVIHQILMNNDFGQEIRIAYFCCNDKSERGPGFAELPDVYTGHQATDHVAWTAIVPAGGKIHNTTRTHTQCYQHVGAQMRKASCYITLIKQGPAWRRVKASKRYHIRIPCARGRRAQMGNATTSGRNRTQSSTPRTTSTNHSTL